MSDKPEGSDPNQGPREEEREDDSKGPSLKDATHKLKAEALRRLQLGDADYEGEGAKNSEARQGSSQNDNSNEQDMGIDGGDRGEILAEKSDVLRKEKDSNVDVTDHDVAGSKLGANKESGTISQDSGKPNDVVTSGDSVANVGDVKRQYKEGSDISANEGDPTSSKVNDQSISKGNMLSSQVENAKQSVSEGQEGASRPSSGGARPGSGSKGAGKGEGSPQKPSSRPGSGSGSRSRPGSGSKRSRQEQQSSSRPGSASGRPGSTSYSRSRPQSGSKQEVTGSLGKDGFSSGGVAEGSANMDSASVDDGRNKFTGDQSQSKLTKDKEGDRSTDGKTTSSGKIIEGASQTLVGDSVEHRQQHDLAVNNKSADNTSVQTLSEENKSESKDADKISDDVSPPMNEGLGSKGQGVNSKQDSDSLSNDKQDSVRTEAGQGDKEGEPSDSVQDDKEKISGSDQAGDNDAKSGEQRDESEASHTQRKGGSKDETTSEGQGGENKASDKDGSRSDATVDKKPAVEEHKDDVTDKSGVQKDQRAGDKDDREESSGKQTTTSKKGDTTAADAGEEKKEDGDRKKKKKEGTEEGEDIEEEESEGAEETGKAVGEPQPTKTKPDEAGRDKM